MNKAQGIPKAFHTLTPHLVVNNAAKAIEFYKKAFGAEEQVRMLTSEKKILHAQLKIGDSMLMLCDEFPNMGGKNSPESLGGSSVTIHVYVDDADAVFDRAVKAGATAIMPVTNMFWGDRYGKLTDPFGHHWSIATKVEELTPDEIQKRQEAFFAQMAGARK